MSLYCAANMAEAPSQSNTTLIFLLSIACIVVLRAGSTVTASAPSAHAVILLVLAARLQYFSNIKDHFMTTSVLQCFSMMNITQTPIGTLPS